MTVAPGSQDTEATDDVNVDVGRFLSVLWKRRVVILVVTVVGAAAGAGFVRMTPVKYLARTQIAVLTASGSALASEAATVFQSALTDPAILSLVLADAALERTDTATLRARMSTRLLPPGSRLIVDIEWPDPRGAEMLANAATKRAFQVVRERQGSRNQSSLTALDSEAAAAEASLETAALALTTMRKSGAMDAARGALDYQTARRRELQDTQTEILTERARLTMLQERLARGGIANLELAALTEQRVVSESRLAGLTALQDHLENVLKGQTRESLIATITDLELRQTRLQTELNRTQQVRDRLVDAAAAARRSALTQSIGLELNAESEATVRPMGPTLMSGLARGAAFGFAVGVFAVFFLNGVWSSFVARRT